MATILMIHFPYFSFHHRPGLEIRHSAQSYLQALPLGNLQRQPLICPGLDRDFPLSQGYRWEETPTVTPWTSHPLHGQWDLLQWADPLKAQHWPLLCLPALVPTSWQDGDLK